MPPKIDPYATSRARAVDIALILFAILVIAIAICTAPRRHSDVGAIATPAHAQVNLAANTSALTTDN